MIKASFVNMSNIFFLKQSLIFVNVLFWSILVYSALTNVDKYNL